MTNEPGRVLDRDTAENEAAIRHETMDIVAHAGARARHLVTSDAASPTSPFSTSSRAYARSSNVVIFRFRRSPGTIFTGMPAATTAAASSLKDRSPAAARALSS